MKKKYIFFFFIIFIFFSQTTFAQNRNRSGLIRENNSVGSLVFTVGPSYLFGDLGGSAKANPTVFDNINFNNIRYEVSLGFRHSFNNRLGYRLSFHHGLYKSQDRASLAETRGYESTSNISMFTALGEFNIFQAIIAQERFWRVYVYGGGGVAHASVNLTGEPLRGGSDTSKTSEFAPIIPFGLGFDIGLNSNFNIGLEFGWKFAFSDYMDGIRVRDSANDVLGNVSLTLSYRIFGSHSLRRNNCVWCN